MRKSPSTAHQVARPLAIEYLPIDSIRERETNSRVHRPEQVRAIANSICSFGFSVPVLVDDDNVLIAGHGRLAAAGLLDIRSVPAVRVSGLTEAQQRAFVIADNKLTDLSFFDKNKLRSEFSFLLGEDTGLAIQSTGFDIVEIDKILNADEAGGGGGGSACRRPRPSRSRAPAICGRWGPIMCCAAARSREKTWCGSWAARRSPSPLRIRPTT